jgi:alginate O-acetyltransferase complex protein AlgI
MVFSAPFFLFFFLPVTLAIVLLTRNAKYKNLILLIISVLFYVFGEGELVILMFGSITLNYYLGKWVGRASTNTAIKVGVGINLLILIVFKYAGFIVENLNLLLAQISIQPLPIPSIKLPAGISFYTFHSISYLIDVHRKDNHYQKSYVDMALYIALFPQLIAGPIIRYKDIALQFTKRVISLPRFRVGVERFIIGLGKKIIIANTLGFMVDSIYDLPTADLSTGTIWLVIIAYSLQLYFDFSGYSDMAIGLAKMLGFDFLENFRFPYAASSIKEFWSKWHISLSNWFRDYLYIPLGGNRVSQTRLYLNLSTVFFLTGLWHGASWSFIVWGMIHGLFMIIERLGFEKILSRLGLIANLYTLLVVAFAWVFFRIDSFEQALQVITGAWQINSMAVVTADLYLTGEILFVLLLAILLSVNGANKMLKYLFQIYFKQNTNQKQRSVVMNTFRLLKTLFLAIMFIYALLTAAAGSYNPFIYFRF